jgi:hypothetical protein
MQLNELIEQVTGFFALVVVPACRFAHAGYLLDSSHPRHSGTRREAQTRNPLSRTMSGEWIPGSLA